MKIQKISQLLTPFAGISFVNQEFNESGLSVLIDNHLGMRSLLGYQYSEIFRAWFDIFFCGGEVAEDIQKYLRPTLENIPSNSVPSADTLHRALKELATENTTVTSTSNREYQFSINERMNNLRGYIKIFIIFTCNKMKNKMTNLKRFILLLALIATLVSCGGDSETIILTKVSHLI